MSEFSVEEISWQKIPMDLLLEADPNPEKILEYLPKSICLVLKKSEEIIGVCAIADLEEKIFELMNIAVSPSFQRLGYGRKLLQKAIRAVKEKKAKRLFVGTGSFGYQLAFYQREGFRVWEIKRDFFLENYPEPIYELGIQLKDMLLLALDFDG